MSTRNAVLGLDQSTSATKAAVFDSQGLALFEATRQHSSSYPRPGWVEQDAETLLANSKAVLSESLLWSSQNGYLVRSLGLTNQRETVVVWDRRTGMAVFPALGWQCLRGQDITARWRKSGWSADVLARTGLPLDPHFSASKIAWVLEEVPGAKDLAVKGLLAFGTVDSWLVYHLTERSIHATDPSNASRTLLYNLRSKDWDDELLGRFGIPRSMAPEIRPSNASFGSVSLPAFENEPLQINAVLGDSHAALLGMGCLDPGQTKVTYGTGSSVMVNLGESLPRRFDGTVAVSVAWGIGPRVLYVLEGNIHHSGDTLRWLVDLGLYSSLAEWETLADQAPHSDGVFLVPAFSGLGAPYWDEKARGALLGLVRSTTKAQIARAGLESLAFQVCDLLEPMRTASGLKLGSVRVDGGPTKNPTLMQFQADTGRCVVSVSGAPNASIFGAAVLAGWSSGMWSESEVRRLLTKSKTAYEPKMPDAEAASLRLGWRNAVRRIGSSVP